MLSLISIMKQPPTMLFLLLRDVTLLILFASNPNQFCWTIRHFIFHYSSQFSCGTSVGVVAAAVLEMSCVSKESKQTKTLLQNTHV
jgi:Na+/glutamate symporter